MHPFERSGLGKAPFRCVGVTKNLFTIPGVPEATKPGSSCDHCGTSITYEYWIVGATGSRFKVGCDCVFKTTQDEKEIKGFREQRLALAKELRLTKTTAKRAQRQAEYEARKAEREKLVPAQVAEFKAANPEFAARLEADISDFGKDLWHKLNAWGNLTQPQMDSIKRGWERDDAKAKERETSTYQGTIGKRLTGVFTVKFVRSTTFMDRYPAVTSHWHIMNDEAGNVYTYRGSRYLGDIGTVVKATFTIKEHTEYQGTKQTVLARPKLEET